MAEIIHTFEIGCRDDAQCNEWKAIFQSVNFVVFDLCITIHVVPRVARSVKVFEIQFFRENASGNGPKLRHNNLKSKHQ